MLKNIKSTFIIKKIFILFKVRRKLKLIKYNKNIQTRIDICLNNFKEFSSKIIMYGEKGKGKEYNIYNNNPIFEGGGIFKRRKKWKRKGILF